MKQFLNSPGSHPPGYSNVVTSTGGTHVFVSGQGGMDAHGVMPADFTSQCINTFENLKTCLGLAGAAFADVVKINYYLTDLDNRPELRRIRALYLNMDAPPASTLVQAGLDGALLLEIECTAVIPDTL